MKERGQEQRVPRPLPALPGGFRSLSHPTPAMERRPCGSRPTRFCAEMSKAMPRSQGRSQSNAVDGQRLTTMHTFAIVADPWSAQSVGRRQHARRQWTPQQPIPRRSRARQSPVAKEETVVVTIAANSSILLATMRSGLQCAPSTSAPRLCPAPSPSKAVAAIVSLALVTSCPDPSQAAPLTPYQEANFIEYGLDAGRIRRCPNAIPNCSSSSSLANDTYSPPWRAPEDFSVDDVARALTAYVLGQFAGATVEAQEPDAAGPGTVYLRLAVPSVWGFDRVEFLMKPGVEDRDWEGDRPGALVLQRSIAGGVKYVWPITQPVTDGGLQRKRLEQIRTGLKFRYVGCELIECFQ